MGARQRTLLIAVAHGRSHPVDKSKKWGLGVVFLRVSLRHPALAGEAVRMALATAAPKWFLRFPFLPSPEPRYRDWRLQTAYKNPDGQPSPREIEEFLRWRRGLRRI